MKKNISSALSVLLLLALPMHNMAWAQTEVAPPPVVQEEVLPVAPQESGLESSAEEAPASVPEAIEVLGTEAEPETPLSELLTDSAEQLLEKAKEELTKMAAAQSAMAGVSGSTGTSTDSGIFNADPSTYLQSFQGKHEVNLFSGVLSYAYALWIPKGRLNMTPAINLTYSSIDSYYSSPVGFGWSLPMNALYRTPKKGTNHIYDETHFSADIFGNTENLIVVDDQNGIYAPKEEGSFNQFTFNGTGWTAKDAHGNTYTFGASQSTRQDDPADSSRVFKWMLEKVEDPNGNFITFTYTKHEGAIYPSTIRYTGFGSDPGIFEIKFNLQNRDAHLNYRTGFQVSFEKLINSIDLITYQSGTPVTFLTYNFNYTKQNNAIWLLDDITVTDGTNSLPPTQFEYYTGADNEPNKKLNALKKILQPYGASQTFTYKPSTAYREQDSSSSNMLPFIVHTVFQHTSQANTSAPAHTTTYDYRSGHYYVDDLDVYRREYAGFGKVTVTDPVGNIRKLFFHQSQFDPSNTEDAAIGEYQDHISKKAKIYRDEQWDASQNLRALTLQQWETEQLADDDTEEDRYFPSLTRQTSVEYGENSESKASAATYEYDDYGNITDEVNYGEVTLTNQTGAFSDISSDTITTQTTYAVNTGARLLRLPSLVERFNHSSALVSRTKRYYDGLSVGQINKGNLTKEEQFKDATNFVDTEITYNTRGLPETTTNPRGYSTATEYDTFFLYPTEITNAKGHVITSTYNPKFGVPTEIIDPNGGTAQYVFDTFGRLTEQKVKAPDSQMKTLKTLAYDLSSTPVSFTQTLHPQNTDTASNAIQITQKTYFDGFGKPLQSKTEAEGANNYTFTSTTYDERGNVKDEYLPQFTSTLNYEAPDTQDPKTSTTYDALSRPKTVTNSLGTTQIAHNDWEKVITDSNGKRKDFLNDARGNLTQVKEYLGSTPYTTTYTYNANNLLTKIADAQGNEKELTYDFLGRKLGEELFHASSNGSPDSYTYAYDENGNPVSVTDAKSQVTTYTYDQLDRPLTENTNQVTYTYDQGTNGIGRLSSVSIPAGDLTLKSFTYDILGRVTLEEKTINGTLFATGSLYDLLGNPTQITYPNSLTVQYGYNNAGQVETVPNYVTDFDSTAAGQIAYTAYENGVTTTNTYDPTKLYRLTHKVTVAPAIEGSTGTSAPITVTFNPPSGDGEVYHSHSTWNTLHHATSGSTTGPTSATLNVGSGKSASTTYRLYRAFLPFDTASLPDDATITDAKLKVYVSSKLNNDNDGSDWVTVVQSSQPSTTTLTTADYDLAGSVHTPTEGIDTGERKDMTSVATGQFLTLNLNATGRGWVSKTGATKLALREGHDIVDSAFTGSSGQYNRLTIRTAEHTGTSSDPVLEVTYTVPEEIPGTPETTVQDISYTYDPIGNITAITDSSETDASKTATYQYDDLYRLTQAAITNTGNSQNYTKTYQYSVNGNMTQSSDLGTYSYAGDHPHAVTGIGSTTYAYDLNGSLTGDGTWTHAYDTRNRLTSSTSGSTAVSYGYDEGTMRVTKEVGATTNVYVNSLYEEEVTGSATTERAFVQAGNMKVATVENSGTPQTHFHHTDHLSGANVTTDEDGAVLELADYFPYGGVRLEQKAAGHENDYLYTGKERDEETGLYYYGARYYSPAIARFTSQDPWAGDIKDPQSFNKYSYVRNNPLKYVDPTGKTVDTLVDTGFTVYDGARTATNFVQTVWNGANLLLNIWTGNVEVAADYANAYDQSLAETGSAATDTALDVGATFIPLLPAAVTRELDNAGWIMNKAPDITKSIWTQGKPGNSVQNAWNHYQKHGNDFPDVQNAKQYVDKATDFMRNPPDGTLTHTTRNGETLFYHPESNTFGMMNKDGVPQTLYKPDPSAHGQASNADYWNSQTLR